MIIGNQETLLDLNFLFFLVLWHLKEVLKIPFLCFSHGFYVFQKRALLREANLPTRGQF